MRIDPKPAPFAPRLLAVALALALPLAAPLAGGGPEAKTEKVDMAEMMKRAERYTKPGEAHRWLERFLGEWETEFRVTMHGAPSNPERGTARATWLIEGRWLKIEGEGTLMGAPARSFFLLGYDNFKMSYVTAAVQSIDTALTTSEGDLDPKTGALVTYGTLDEYLTGEHDKMVKYVWRFRNADTFVLEVHDLPIGESDTQVVEVVHRRKPGR